MNSTRVLGATDVKYKIICAGSKFDVGCNKPVIVEYNGRKYQAKMHSKTKGRIDGLGELFSDFSFCEGQELQLSYDAFSNTIKIQSASSVGIMKKSSKDNTKNLFEDNMKNFFEDNTKNNWKEPEFQGEYYNGRNHHRAIARYKDNVYFVDNGDVITCKYEHHASKKVLIKNALKLKVNQPWGCIQIFVNRHGIFVYRTNADRGNICKLFDFNGKEKGCFSIQRRGRSSDSNLICAAYIKDSRFFCVTDKEYYGYDFEAETKSCTEFTLPEDTTITGLCVGDTKVYLRIRKRGRKKTTQWYRLKTNSTLMYTDGTMQPVFRNLGEYEMYFIYPQKDIAWIEKNIQPNVLAYFEVQLSTGKFTGKKYRVNNCGSSEDIAYFDGEIMYQVFNDEVMNKIDLSTGEAIRVGNFYILEANRFLVYENKLYIEDDFGVFSQYIVTIPVDDTKPDVEICERIW